MSNKLICGVTIACLFAAGQSTPAQELEPAAPPPSEVAPTDRDVETVEVETVEVEPEVETVEVQETEEVASESVETEIQPDGDGLSAMMSGMMAGVLESYLDFLARPSTSARLAKFQKNYYDALQEEGFSKQEAFELLQASGNPLGGVLSGN